MKSCKNIHIPLLILFLLICLLPSGARSQTAEGSCGMVIDSLQKLIDKAQGEKKLELYAKICMETASLNNIEDILLWFNVYQQEAARQENVKHEANARTQRLYAFYNHGMSDSLELYLDNDLSFMAFHRQWILYYSNWSLRVERFLYDNKLHNALHESQRMYDDAKERKQDNGLGMSAYLIGASYQSMEQNDEASDFLLRAEHYLMKEANTGQLHNVYTMAWQSLSADGRYDELLAMTDRWEKMWKDYRLKADISVNALAPYLIVCHLARAHAFMKKEDLPAARLSLDKAQACAEGLSDITRILLYQEEALYEELCGNYERALTFVDSRQRLLDNLDNRLNSIENQRTRAHLLLKLGRSDESALLYETLLPQKDSINNSTLCAQLNELSSIYKVDQYRLESEKHQLQFVFALCGCALLLILLGLLYYHNRTVKSKNTALVARLRKQETAEAQMKAAEAARPIETLSSDKRLFRQIEQLFEDKDIFLLPKLGRNELAEMLATNRTYIANAIRNCTEEAFSISEYINGQRVKYARHLLEFRPDLSIEEVSEMCGFNTRNGLYKAFRSRYDMAPADFRKVTLRNK